MAHRSVTIKVPCMEKNGQTVIREITGRPVRIYVGRTQFRFAILGEGAHKNLTHIDSGFKIGNITELQIRHFRSYKRMDDREAAVLLVNLTIEKYGLDRVIKVIKSAPVIN